MRATWKDVKPRASTTGGRFENTALAEPTSTHAPIVNNICWLYGKVLYVSKPAKSCSFYENNLCSLRTYYGQVRTKGQNLLKWLKVRSKYILLLFCKINRFYRRADWHIYSIKSRVFYTVQLLKRLCKYIKRNHYLFIYLFNLKNNHFIL